MDKKDRFYFDGIFYEDYEEFLKATSRFANSEISPESFKRIMDEFGRSIALNIFLKEHEITNGDLKEILEKTFIYFLKEHNALKNSP